MQDQGLDWERFRAPSPLTQLFGWLGDLLHLQHLTNKDATTALRQGSAKSGPRAKSGPQALSIRPASCNIMTARVVTCGVDHAPAPTAAWLMRQHHTHPFIVCWEEPVSFFSLSYFFRYTWFSEKNVWLSMAILSSLTCGFYTGPAHGKLVGGPSGPLS